MSEPEVEAVVKSRGYTVGRVLRFVDFETQVRAAINAHGGAGGRPTKYAVLGEASLTDRNGGKYQLKMLVWPDGSHLDAVTYIAPRGTGSEDWRRVLVAKWGRSDSETIGQSFVARWRGRDAAGPGQAHRSDHLGERFPSSPQKAPRGVPPPWSIRR
ncbi:hypothetical protein U1737_08980 [Sphingomonas sp. LB3N6]|uniref:hypothetical protein n=1 Tax=Sphingomonas fucosidasi TaxID=3096164 RepID=UPI002FC9BBF1